MRAAKLSSACEPAELQKKRHVDSFCFYVIFSHSLFDMHEPTDLLTPNIWHFVFANVNGIYHTHSENLECTKIRCWFFSWL